MKTHPRHGLLTLLATLALSASTALGAMPQTDDAARALAESVMERMGGHEAWNNTRHLAWTFFGGRQHYWDKWTGNIRIEIPEGQGRDGSRTPSALILMNLNSREGRAWTDGEEISGEALTAAMERGWRSWVNDSYWMFMPYKLLDPGVTLRHMGEDLMADDREADVLEMTFDSVGVTPNNRYLIYVARDSGLIEQWSHFTNRDDPEPRFTMPWEGWERFGSIMLSTSRGRGHEWNIRVYGELPEALYSDPNYEHR